MKMTEATQKVKMIYGLVLPHRGMSPAEHLKLIEKIAAIASEPAPKRKTQNRKQKEGYDRKA